MRLLLTTSVLLCLAMPAVAQADGSVTSLLREACNNERVTGHYTQAQYKKALDSLATDSDEYTACREVLQRGRLAALSTPKKQQGGNGAGASTGAGGGGSTGGGSTGGGSGSSSGASSGSAGGDPLANATADQRKAVVDAGKTAKAVDVGGQLVKPGSIGLGELAGSGHDVPTTLVVLIGLLAAGALGAGGWWLWSRVLARRFG
jgi:hypothetical protein